MKYDVLLDVEAERTLLELPFDVAVAIHDALEKLAESPFLLAKRPIFPLPPIGMLYEFWCDTAEGIWFVTAYFAFGQDEKTLNVYAIAPRQFPQPGESGK